MGISAAIIGVGTVLYSQDQSRKQAHTQADAIKAQTEATTKALANNPQPVMPTPDDASVQSAKQASIAEQVARRGRASTILTGPTAERLGS